jgi:hypothetical protein
MSVIEIGLPTLSASMQLSGPRGMCFHRAIALCLDLPGSELIVATLRAATLEERKLVPNASPVRFFHAWVEWQSRLLAPSTIEQAGGNLLSLYPTEYYLKNGVQDPRRISRDRVKEFCDDLILSHLLYGTAVPHGYVVDRLFGAAGLRYKVSPQGGVIPL